MKAIYRPNEKGKLKNVQGARFDEIVSASGNIDSPLEIFSGDSVEAIRASAGMSLVDPPKTAQPAPPPSLKDLLGAFWNSLDDSQKEAIADDFATVRTLLDSGDTGAAKLRCQKVAAQIVSNLTDAQKAKAQAALAAFPTSPNPTQTPA